MSCCRPNLVHRVPPSEMLVESAGKSPWGASVKLTDHCRESTLWGYASRMYWEATLLGVVELIE